MGQRLSVRIPKLRQQQAKAWANSRGPRPLNDPQGTVFVHKINSFYATVVFVAEGNSED